MNQSDEDAIYFAALNSDESKNELGMLSYSKAFKVAIRAAYAKGAEDMKERAAKVCEDDSMQDVQSEHQSGYNLATRHCADAIRRG